MHSYFPEQLFEGISEWGLNPFKAIGGHFDLVKLKKLYVDRVSIINTLNYVNGSTNLFSFREN